NPRSEEPMAIIEEVVAGIPSGANPIVVADRRLAIREALAGRAPGDVVVVAGKGHESGQTAGGVTVPFDDRVVAREELARLGWSTRAAGARETAGTASAAEKAGPAGAGGGAAG
ncbi:MAG: UDP-N-acetylmuramoyl-L-alanyl-D-glutamate--2,6-diaminopimelate ligase, partial [Actinomycetota bacterium]|nr:UDP-N-acetylmuramoyl-L-alanyl-D-glutamate--2,6-diaminopimelate ligase [Actinomycetota bacterium]